MVLVQAHAGDTVGTGWTYGPAACAAVITGTLAGIVRDRDALDVGGAFGAMVKAVRNAGRPGAVGYAISAVDVALWDLKAKLLDLPLHRLLGAVRDAVPVYGSGGFTSYNERQLRDQLTGWALEQRIPRVKIKIGQSWGTSTGRDLDRMRQARAAIGEQTELFVDANGGYRRKQAIRVMHAAADLDVRWFENPSPPTISTASGKSATLWHRMSPPASTATTCSTAAACAPPARSTACRPMSPAAAGSPNGCGPRPSLPPTAWTSPDTAARTCTPTPPPPPRTYGTWNGSTITSGSSRCSSTEHSTQLEVSSGRTRPQPATA
jgi:L-alanine-DL-glutamate epimerase-like enolase superfamily enzyme